MEIERNGFIVSTDRSRLDIDVIHSFLSRESYWAANRSRQSTEIAIENSICFGLYKNSDQIGFARVVTDKATFAYLGDVFIVGGYRGRGLSKWLMEAVISHPELQGLRRWVLATRDAHELYRKFGFDELRFPDRWMELAAADAY